MMLKKKKKKSEMEKSSKIKFIIARLSVSFILGCPYKIYLENNFFIRNEIVGSDK